MVGRSCRSAVFATKTSVPWFGAATLIVSRLLIELRQSGSFALPLELLFFDLKSDADLSFKPGKVHGTQRVSF